MIDRKEVEAMLVACQSDRAGPHPSNETLAELCRTWLAVQDAPVREVISDGQYDYIGASGLGMLGQRVRIVPDPVTATARPYGEVK